MKRTRGSWKEMRSSWKRVKEKVRGVVVHVARKILRDRGVAGTGKGGGGGCHDSNITTATVDESRKVMADPVEQGFSLTIVAERR